MNAKTRQILDKMIAHSRQGFDIIPAFYQPIYGRSNAVSAAIRAGKKMGLIEVAGTDGHGKPIYRAVMPSTTHDAPSDLN